MKRLKEKLKAIWHIIKDEEYIVLTVTIKDLKRKSCAALVSDNASNEIIEAGIDFLTQNKRR